MRISDGKGATIDKQPSILVSANVAPLSSVGGSQRYGVAVYHAANDKHVALVQTGGAASNAANLKYYVVVTR